MPKRPPTTRPVGGPDDRPRHKRSPLRIVAWNAHNAPVERLRSLIRDWARNGADLIILNEVWSRRAALLNIAKTMGWTLHQEPAGNRGADPVPEAGSTAVLVRKGLEVRADKVIAGRVQWTVFSHNRRHMPRRHQRVRVAEGGQVYKITGTHGPTNGPTGGNAPAFREYQGQILRWHDVQPDDVCAVTVGDINWKLADLKRWAKTHGIKVAGHNVDACLVSNGRVKRKVLGNYGSDHKAVRYEVTAK